MSNPSAPDVVVAGHICLDVIPDLTHVELENPGQFYTPGKLLNTRAAALSTGGPVSNTGLALRKLGLSATLMGKVGADPFGQLVQILLRDRWGITGGLRVAPEATTSYTVVIAPFGFDRMFLHHPGANDTFGADDIDYDLVAQARHFHLGYPPLMQRMFENNARELVRIFQRVHELGVTTSLDMSLPDPASASGRVDWKAVLRDLVPFVDICLPSVEESTFMLERERFLAMRAEGGDLIGRFTGDDLHRLSDTLLGFGGKILAIKCGYRGYYCRTAEPRVLDQIGRAKPGDPGQWANREVWQPTYHVDTYASATGSGDSSIAGFLSAYLRGLSLDHTLRYATAAGALNVTAPDALSGLKTWEEMTQMMRDGWKTDPLTVAGEGWRQIGDRWFGPADRS